MGLSFQHPNQPKLWLLASLIGLNINLFSNQQAKAFVPYIFNPDSKDLNTTSISFGKTAAQLLHFGQTKEASRVAKLAVRLNPNDERLWSILAETQARNRLFKKASQSLAKAKRINPKNANLWFAEGSLQLQQKNPKGAILYLREGLALDPNNATAYFQLGNARIMESKLKLALHAFKKAENIKPKFWEAINNQGLVLFEMGKKKEAIKTWRNVLAIKENAEPMLALAAALNQIYKTSQESLTLAKTALTQNPNYVSRKHQADQLWGRKLQQATKQLFKHPELSYDVERALANSN